jgi:hypothetical protein
MSRTKPENLKQTKEEHKDRSKRTKYLDEFDEFGKSLKITIDLVYVIQKIFKDSYQSSIQENQLK